MGVLIEAPGCFPGLTMFDNMMLQASNLNIPNAEQEVIKVLKTVRMEGAAGNKYKNCSLGMKQRVGIAMALLGDPTLLVLDEPLNGLDADGMRIMREVFLDIIKDGKRSIIVSSHLLGELQKVATHYGIIRHGKMIVEMTADELDASCRTYVALTSAEMNRTKMLLGCKYSRVEEDEAGYIRVYDLTTPEEIVTYLYENGICVTEIKTDKIGLEEYYIDLMKGGK
jgi:ABC-2 type transport system ATP-binding protein